MKFARGTENRPPGNSFMNHKPKRAWNTISISGIVTMHSAMLSTL